MRRQIATILFTLSILTVVFIVVINIHFLVTPRRRPDVFRFRSRAARAHNRDPDQRAAFGAGGLQNKDKPPQQERKQQKYLIYLCDKLASCGGWGDRQRGFVSSFLVANLTGRRFGINMSVPCHITNYYWPNIIDWVVTEEEIEGKSTRYINSINDESKGSFHANLSFVDFNREYPEDVIFLRTNVEHFWPMRLNKLYKTKTNPWIFHGRPRFFDDSWKWLMAPAPLLRDMASDLLSKWGYFNRTKPLVCAHIRIGSTKGRWTDSKAFNDINSLDPLWAFLTPHVKAGSPIFLASDNAMVRQMSKTRFGSAHHDTGGVIEHVDRKRTGDDEGCEGFLYALLDQMVLTLCDILVITNSNFGYRAALIRATTDGLYWFRKGNVSHVKAL